MDFSGNQLRAARVLLGLGQIAFAKAVGASVNTIRTMEAFGDESVGGFASTRDRVREALEAMGIRFTNGDEPGVIWSKHKAKGDTTMAKKQTTRSKGATAAGRKPYPVPPAKTGKNTPQKSKT